MPIDLVKIFGSLVGVLRYFNGRVHPDSKTEPHSCGGLGGYRPKIEKRTKLRHDFAKKCEKSYTETTYYRGMPITVVLFIFALLMTSFDDVSFLVSL